MIKSIRSIYIDTFNTCDKVYCISKNYGELNKTFVYSNSNNKLYNVIAGFNKKGYVILFLMQ